MEMNNAVLKDGNLRTLVARSEQQRILYKAILQDRSLPQSLRYEFMLKLNKVSKKFVTNKKINVLNGSQITINVKEDDIVFFPSKTPHSTQPTNNNDERISISADIVCIAKNSETLEHLTPVSYTHLTLPTILLV